MADQQIALQVVANDLASATIQRVNENVKSFTDTSNRGTKATIDFGDGLHKAATAVQHMATEVVGLNRAQGMLLEGLLSFGVGEGIVVAIAVAVAALGKAIESANSRAKDLLESLNKVEDALNEIAGKQLEGKWQQAQIKFMEAADNLQASQQSSIRAAVMRMLGEDPQAAYNKALAELIQASGELEKQREEQQKEAAAKAKALADQEKAYVRQSLDNLFKQIEGFNALHNSYALTKTDEQARLALLDALNQMVQAHTLNLEDQQHAVKLLADAYDKANVGLTAFRGNQILAGAGETTGQNYGLNTGIEKANAGGLSPALAGIGAEAWQKRVKDLTDQTPKLTEFGKALEAVGGSWEKMAKSLLTQSPLKSVQELMKGMAESIGEFYMKEGIAKIAAAIWPPNPAMLTSGLEELAAGTALAAIGGAISGSGGGGGGAGSASGHLSQQERALSTFGQGTVTVHMPANAMLRAGDPGFQQFFAQVAQQAQGRRLVFETR